jgi:ATP-binding cassette, subfamily C, bacterial
MACLDSYVSAKLPSRPEVALLHTFPILDTCESRFLKQIRLDTVRFVGYFMRGYPVRSALMICLLVLGGFAEGIGLVTLLPLLNIVIGDGGGGANDALAGAVEGFFGRIGVDPTPGVLLAVIVGGISFKAGFVWLGMTQVGYMIARVTADLRLRLIRALMEAKWSYFVRQPLGSFSNAVASEAHRAGFAYREACTAGASSIQALAYFIVAAAISWPVAILGLLAGMGFVYGLNGFVRMSRSAGQDMTDLMSALTERLTDTVHGLKAVKAMGLEARLAPLLEDRTKALQKAQRRQVLALESMQLFQEPLIALIVAVGMIVLLSVGNIAFSSLLVLIFIFYRLLRFFNSMQNRLQGMVEGESAFWSLWNKIQRAEENREAESGTLPPPAAEQGIEFEDVSFAYQDDPVLQGVSITIPARGFTSIVGESGSGKTTTGDLIVGLLRPTSGRILVDGVPLDEIQLRAWRGQIGYVPQEILLFHDSILHNVTLGDRTITEADAEEALRMAGAWGFVQRLPRGIHEVTGERGGTLSGGQRQRIGLARALVRRPRVLILDEATAALDPATERAIAETVRELADRVTVISISHRSAINDLADTVVEIEDGTARVVRQPTRAAALGHPSVAGPASG